MADNRYGLFKYGTSHKYGESSLSEGLAWVIEIDWDGDGVFDGQNEAFYLMTAPKITRGRRAMLRPSGQGFEGVRTGQASFHLSNHDGRYDAWNTSSPLYPNIESGKDVKIRVLDRATGDVYNRFYGIVSDIIPVGYGADAYVIIYVEDAMRVLRDASALAFSTAPQSVSSLIQNNLLDSALDWPIRWGYTLDNSSDYIFHWYANGDRSVAAELEDLALSFFGYMFIAADGQFRFISKFGNITPVMDISQDEILKDIGNPQPWTIRRDVVKMRFHVRKTAYDVTIWQPLDTDPAIQPGASTEYILDYTYNGYPAFAFGLDDLFTFSKGPYTLDPGTGGSASYTHYGIKAFLTISNGGSDSLYMYVAHDQDVDFPENNSFIKGDITWTERADTISSPRNPTGLTTSRQLVLDSLWYQNRYQAYEMVDNYQAFISQLHKTPIIQIENRPGKQFAPDLFDVITVDIPHLGINEEDFRVGAIEDEPLGDNSQAVRTTFYLEPFLQPNPDAGKWGTGEWDVSEWDW